MKKKVIFFLMTLVCAVSCIYPYEAEVGGTGGNLVVEGDIILGSVSNFALSYLIPLGENNPAAIAPNAQIWVEDKNGRKYPGEPVTAHSPGPGPKTAEFNVDLSDADPSVEHRLYIRTDVGRYSYGGKEYASQWAGASGTCVIDNLGYSVVKENDTSVGVDILMSMHSGDDTKHFRYRYTETWEYTSYWEATCFFNTNTGEVERFAVGENYYYCWNSVKSRGINLATTETMGEDTLQDYPLFRYSRDNQKLAVLYRLDLEVYPVSEENYRYLEHIKEVSTYDGSLFAPIPSEVRGNIRCVTDENEMVYGYVGTSCPQKARMYYDNSVERLYGMPIDREASYESVPSEHWWYYYQTRRWRPYYMDMAKGVFWAPERCLDCRLAGGNKNKPADWPNRHY